MKKNQKKNAVHEEPMFCTTEYPVDIKFSPEELADKSELLVDSHRIINEIMLERKEAMQEFNKRLSGVNKDINKLCSDLTKKSENRMATCKVRYDFNKQMKYVLHPQTGEVVREIPTDLDDLRLFAEWKKSKKKEAKPVVLALPPANEIIEAEAEDENKKQEGSDAEENGGDPE